MEPFLLKGAFRKQNLPEFIIKKVLGFYEERKNFKMLERIVMQIDLSEYSLREELMVTCQLNCLISALLYLMSAH